MNAKKTQPISSELPSPHSIEAEKAVLGAMIQDISSVDSAVVILSPEDFYVKAHEIIFEKIQELWNKNEPADNITIIDSLKKDGLIEQVGGVHYIAELQAQVSSIDRTKTYSKIIKEHSIIRQVVAWASTLTEECRDSLIDSNAVMEKMEEHIVSIIRQKQKESIMDVESLVKEGMGFVDKMYGRVEDTNIKTGFAEMDKAINYLMPGAFIVIAGRPSMGKSALAMAIAENVAINQKKCVFVTSVEMRPVDLIVRMLCSRAGVSMFDLMSHNVQDSHLDKFIKEADNIRKARIFIDNSASTTAPEIRAKCRKMKAVEKIDLIIVDYLQLVRPITKRSSDSRQNEIAVISGQLKTIATELNVPIIVLSQLNRQVEGRQDHKPMLYDLRDSGSIEQDADIVILLHRPSMYRDDKHEDNIVEVQIAKNRNGPLKNFQLMFEPELMRYSDYQP